MERRKLWSFFITPNGKWVWRVLHPDLTEECAAIAFENIQACKADAQQHGYVPVRLADERRRSEQQ